MNGLIDTLFGLGLGLLMVLACVCIALAILLVGRGCVMTIRWFFKPAPSSIPGFIQLPINKKDTTHLRKAQPFNVILDSKEDKPVKWLGEDDGEDWRP